MIRHHDTADALCRYVREQTGDTAILSFSCGKDAIAAWLQLRRYFKRIVPVFFEGIPDLEFVNESLAYYEDFFATKIERYPHPSFFRKIRNMVYQPPQHCDAIERMNIPRHYGYTDAHDDIRERYEIPEAYAGTGIRTADSLIRRAAARTHGVLNPTKREFWPVFDWRAADLVREFSAARVELPVDYAMFGRSFDGIDHRFLEPVRQRFPRDYERILEWFPLAHLDTMRRHLDPETP